MVSNKKKSVSKVDYINKMLYNITIIDMFDTSFEEENANIKQKQVNMDTCVVFPIFYTIYIKDDISSQLESNGILVGYSL